MGEEPQSNIGISFFDLVWDLIKLNILWLLFSLPFITAGAAFTAAYTLTFRWRRGEAPPFFETFWHSFKKNLRQSCLAQLGCLLLAGFGEILLQAGTAVPALGWIAVPSGVFVLALALITSILVFPVLAYFELSVLQAFQNALYLLAHDTLFVMGAVLTVVVGISFIYFVPPLALVMGSLVIYLNTVTLGWVFEKIISRRPSNECEGK